MKRCRKCGVEKSASEFSPNRSCKDGLTSRCKECRREDRAAIAEQTNARLRAKYAEDSTKQRERALRYYYANFEKVSAKRRDRTPEQIARDREQSRAWYAAHKEQSVVNGRRWRRENAHYRQSTEKNRLARELGYYVEDVDRLEVFRRYGGLCGICGDPVSEHLFEVDHIIPVSRGGWHAYDNCQPAHPPCNQSKKDRIWTPAVMPLCAEGIELEELAVALAEDLEEFPLLARR